EASKGRPTSAGGIGPRSSGQARRVRGRRRRRPAAPGGCPSPRGGTPTCPEDALHTLDHQVSTHLRAKVQKRHSFGPGAATDQQPQPTGGSTGGAGSRNPRGATSAAATSVAPPFQLQHVRPIVAPPARSGASAHDSSDRAAPSGWTSLTLPPGSLGRPGPVCASYARTAELPGRSTFTGGR
ncbi:unnamed protein product, partial [Prorocentrum cordatum]